MRGCAWRWCHPRQVKNLRSRYGGAGKDDRFDAYLLADTMRTDGHRYTDLTRDIPVTTSLRALVRARTDLVEICIGLVTSYATPWSWHFPARSDCSSICTARSPGRSCAGSRPAAEAAVLDEEAMAAWLAAEGYPGGPRPRTSSTGCAPPRPVSPASKPTHAGT